MACWFNCVAVAQWLADFVCSSGIIWRVVTCMAPKNLIKIQWIHSFQWVKQSDQNTLFNICDQTFIFTLKSIFDKQPDRRKKYFDKQPDIKICSKLESKFQQVRGILFNSPCPWWCSWVSTRVFGKTNRDLEYVIFSNICDVRKRHKSDHPYKQTFVHANKIELSFGYT
jgi:hypothetical protein